jgi:signal transduction histidine kinase
METEPPCDCACDPGDTTPEPSPNGNGADGQGQIRVLLIDDDEDDYILTRELLDEVPLGRFTLDWCSSYDDGLTALCSGTHHVYLLDYRLGAKSGIDLLREAHTRDCAGPIILLTGRGQSKTDIEALDAGADDYLEKAGLTPATLERAIRYALVQYHAEAELERKVKERTDELARANDALRQADRRKDEFLSTLGHELRNPLAPILNALEILRLAGDDHEVAARQRERLERQVNQMVRLIDDLLEVSRIVTGKLRLTLEPVILQDVLEAALDMSRPNIERAGLHLDLAITAEPIHLHADRIRLAQVFSNLLNNAAKYTEPRGRVSVRVERGAPTPEATSSHRDAHDSSRAVEFVTVRVKDTGVGIPAPILAQLFELFTQVDRHLNRSQGGLGVGLALVRRLVEMHGGWVSAASNGPGAGAEFVVSLPTTSALS